MDFNNRLFRVLGLNPNDTSAIKDFSNKAGIKWEDFKFYNEFNKLPSGTELDQIVKVSGVQLLEIKLSMGIFDQKLKELIAKNSKTIASLLKEETISKDNSTELKKSFVTDFGTLYNGDCLKLLRELESESVDLVFADPPFNLDKFYLSKIDDNLKEVEYLSWCEEWIRECTRVLKKGGSFFLWNLPKWNTYLSEFLNHNLTFRNWISTDIKFSLPISGRLYPSHYSLLYYVKGAKPNSFHPDRMAMETCPKCFGDIKDYGGYKNKMNPNGVNLSDVWLDIPPVRHKKYKRRKEANELSIKLLDRIIEMATEPGDVVFDPFGGSGTTYIVAEIKKRKWLGVELGPVDQIIDRFADIDEEKSYLEKYRSNYNTLFPEKVKKERNKRGLWTDETFHENSGMPKAKMNEQGQLF